MNPKMMMLSERSHVKESNTVNVLEYKTLEITNSYSIRKQPWLSGDRDGRQGGTGRKDCKELEETLGLADKCTILIVMMVSRVPACVKTSQIIYLKYVQFMIC